MNKLALIRNLFLLVLTVLPCSASAIEFYLVEGDNVNIRKGPGQQWRVLSKVDDGQLVLETRRQGYWSEVFYLDRRKTKIQGWIYNTYLVPQVLSGEPSSKDELQVDVSAKQTVCVDKAGVSIGSTCYLDVNFHLVVPQAEVKEVRISCWADFVIPGHKDVTPVQASHTDVFHVLGGAVEGQMRLTAGLNLIVAPKDYSATYYNCSAVKIE